MASIQLKRLIGKTHGRNSILKDLAQVAPRLCIQDAEGSLLLNSLGENTRYPITYQGETLGWVSGDEQAPLVASLLSHYARQEAENANLSDEVLDLYREINLVYNFSEKLTDLLDPVAVASLTLDECQRKITATSGSLMLVSEETQALETISTFGSCFEITEHPYLQDGIIRAVALGGKAEIVNEVWLDRRYSAKSDGAIRSLIAAPLKVKQENRGSLLLVSDQPITYEAHDLKLLIVLASQAATAIENAHLHLKILQEELIRANFLRQFSPKVADKLVKRSSHLQLGGELVAPITLLVSDVRGFTALSANLDPAEVVSRLNRMFGLLIPIIFEHDGTVDKYVGDAILTVFGSPEPDDNQWIKAVKTGLEMQRAMRELGFGWEIGIGIHTGAAIHGFIGSSARMEYTVIGDTVNRVSRLSDGAKGGEVVISQAVYQKISHDITVQPQPRIVKTKHPETETDLEAYVVLGIN
jgi:adenylate cyclase